MSKGKTPEQDVEKQTSGGVTALERGLALIMVIGQQGDGLTLSEAARRAALNKTTAYRLLQSLEAFAFVHRSADQRYVLGPAIAVLNRSAGNAGWLEAAVRSALERLANDTGETAALFVRQGNERLCIVCVQGRHSVAHSLKVGDRLPLDRGASGEVLIRYQKGRPERYATEVTYSIGARVSELAAVAVPIFDANGNLLGSISLSGTATRYNDRNYLNSLIDQTATAAEKINATLSLKHA